MASGRDSDEAAVALGQVGRAALIAGIAVGVTLAVVLAAAAASSGPLVDLGTCRAARADPPYPLSDTCKTFYDSVVPVLTLLSGLGALVFGLTVRSLVGPREWLTAAAARSVSGILWCVAVGPVLALSVYGVASASHGGHFFAVRWLFVALPGLAVFVAMFVPSVYYSAPVRDGRYR